MTLVGDVSKFSNIVNLIAFDPFKNTESASRTATRFPKQNLPQKKKKVIIGVNDGKLASSLAESFLELKADLRKSHHRDPPRHPCSL
ncbi:unnamed protein product, partial [Mesorhabditis spiculigera]